MFSSILAKLKAQFLYIAVGSNSYDWNDVKNNPIKLPIQSCCLTLNVEIAEFRQER